MVRFLGPAACAGSVLAALLLLTPRLHATFDRVFVAVEKGPRVEVFRLLPLYRGVTATVTIEGASVDKSERIELGAGASVPAASIRRAPGRLTFDVATDAGATLGPRDLKLRYAIELSGPESFPVRVLRNGSAERVEPRRVPLGRPVRLTFTGRDLGNADVLASSAYQKARVLPGSSETRCLVDVTFLKEGTIRLALYDRDGPPLPAQNPQEPGGYRTSREALVEVFRDGGKP